MHPVNRRMVEGEANKTQRCLPSLCRSFCQVNLIKRLTFWGLRQHQMVMYECRWDTCTTWLGPCTSAASCMQRENDFWWVAKKEFLMLHFLGRSWHHTDRSACVVRNIHHQSIGTSYPSILVYLFSQLKTPICSFVPIHRWVGWQTKSWTKRSSFVVFSSSTIKNHRGGIWHSIGIIHPSIET